MSSNEFVLEAKPREDVGKGASRRLRRLAGEIPAIIYGGGKDPAPITLSHDDMFHAIENEAFFSHVITIRVGKQEESVIIKDLQRHPARPKLLHADFMRIRADQAITVRVPLHFANEEKCAGAKHGGVVNHLMTELEISCLPKDLPEYIEVDILHLDVGGSLHISDLKLPGGVSSVDLAHGEAGNHIVVSVSVVREEVVEEGAPEAPEAPEQVEEEKPEEGGEEEGKE